MTAVLLTMTTLGTGAESAQDRGAIGVRSPIVLLVGCAGTTAEPHVWTLSSSGERTVSPTPGITAAEKENLAKRPMGRDSYHLIGVADFVDAETARRIGVRGALFTSARVNATGALVSGHKVAVKGLYVDASPPRINVTSVVDLGPCP